MAGKNLFKKRRGLKNRQSEPNANHQKSQKKQKKIY